MHRCGNAKSCITREGEKLEGKDRGELKFLLLLLFIIGSFCLMLKTRRPQKMHTMTAIPPCYDICFDRMCPLYNYIFTRLDEIWT